MFAADIPTEHNSRRATSLPAVSDQDTAGEVRLASGGPEKPGRRLASVLQNERCLDREAGAEGEGDTRQRCLALAQLVEDEQDGR